MWFLILSLVSCPNWFRKLRPKNPTGAQSSQHKFDQKFIAKALILCPNVSSWIPNSSIETQRPPQYFFHLTQTLTNQTSPFHASPHTPHQLPNTTLHHVTWVDRTTYIRAARGVYHVYLVTLGLSDSDFSLWEEQGVNFRNKSIFISNFDLTSRW